MFQRVPYTGASRKLLLGIDVGTTYSGVSYCVLDPGQVPEVKHVTRFPAQERAGADSKIPSIIYYDEKSVPRAFGAEALDGAIVSMANESWTRVEWFKLFLAKSPAVHKKLISLPPGLNVVAVFADFLAYLFKCTEDYIVQTLHNGQSLWDGVQNGQVQFVLTHPNAWEGSQQGQLREAAVMAGLIPDTPSGHEHLQFVTEGEASLHFCLQQGFQQPVPQACTTPFIPLSPSQPKQGNNGILIIDAGGGTIDISAYAPVSFHGKTGYEEIATPHCQFNGSVFVRFEARRQLSKKLKDSKFFDDLDDIVGKFDSSAKLTFRNPQDPSFIQFGRARDNDASVGIKNGQMRISGDEVASFFEPSIQSIIEAVTSIGFDASNSVTRAFLVGGFAASDHLFNRLKSHFTPLGIEILRPDAHINKAVSDGAIGYFVDRHVSVRIARYNYGVKVNFLYNTDDPEHRKRVNEVYVGYDGQKRVRGGFDSILRKNTKIVETKEFKQSYLQFFDDVPRKSLCVEVFQYVGTQTNPKWCDIEPSKFLLLCTLIINSETVSRMAVSQQNNLKLYYLVEYDVHLHFGLTELKAQVVWKQNGSEQRSPATVIYTNDKPSVVYSKFGRDEETIEHDDSERTRVE
ncbi:hypothetical protein DL96DRAFT_1714964 [Flagelloscypha sp. PMI_526]|nr:hypothetical protein DL96DRAFT_1714964 [Flagelloscypha sp. PMI_526]